MFTYFFRVKEHTPSIYVAHHLKVDWSKVVSLWKFPCLVLRQPTTNLIPQIFDKIISAQFSALQV